MTINFTDGSHFECSTDEIKALIAFYEDFDKKAKDYFTNNFPLTSF